MHRRRGPDAGVRTATDLHHDNRRSCRSRCNSRLRVVQLLDKVVEGPDGSQRLKLSFLAEGLHLVSVEIGLSLSVCHLHLLLQVSADLLVVLAQQLPGNVADVRPRGLARQRPRVLVLLLLLLLLKESRSWCGRDGESLVVVLLRVLVLLVLREGGCGAFGVKEGVP